MSRHDAGARRFLLSPVPPSAPSRQPPIGRPTLKVLDEQSRRPHDAADNLVALPEPAAGPHKPIRRLLKRGLDIAIATTALTLGLPLLLFVALLVRLSSDGPVIFSHPRVGKGGRIFPCYKFRSMRVDGDQLLASYLAANSAAASQWSANHKLEHDPRVTSIGHILRKSSLDELPQFMNILLGQMSCVGPRPISPDELTRYGNHVADYLSVRPGLTGLWQVSGRSKLSYARRIELDADYVTHWSLRRDLMILAMTIPAVMKHDQAA